MGVVFWFLVTCMALAYTAVAAVQWWKSEAQLREMKEGEELERLSQLSMITPATPERMEQARRAEPLTAQRAVREMKRQS